MTVKQVAELEGVTERQIQRYISLGCKGHKLPATRMRRAFVIAEDDYKLWRLECGFDFLPQPGSPGEPPSVVTVAAVPAPSASDAERLSFEEIKRRYFSPDRIGGPITNVPAFGSGSMCNPETARLYHEAQARKMKQQLRGYDDDNE
jgi:hypothetical protein